MMKAKAKYSIGIDIGGTKINTGVLDDNGRIIYKHKIMTGAGRDYQNILTDIKQEIKRALEKTGMAGEEILGAGIGVPGTVDPERGKVVKAPNLGWKEIPLIRDLQTDYQFALYLEQDARAASLAELLFGAGQGCRYLVCLTIGTGIGSGIIINGRIYGGGFNTAGEVGHIIVEKDGRPCNCGQRGCLETYTSGPALEREARKRFKDEQLTAARVFALAREGNETALQLIKEVVDYLGIGLVNLLNTLSPEKILISGGMSSEQELLIEPVKRFVREHGYSVAARAVQIEQSQLGEDAPMIGAAMLYQDRQVK